MLIKKLSPMFIQRFIKNRPILSFSILIGIISSFFLPHSLNYISKFLIIWNICVWCYLILISKMMFTAQHFKVREIAKQQDKGYVAILLIMIIAILMSFFAILIELSQLKDLSKLSQTFHFFITGSTIICSWLLLGIIFTLHYAYLFYFTSNNACLKFPNNEKKPNYWDFLYFSFTICVASQTSDIIVVTKKMRKIVLFHQLISFFFNLTVVGLSINIVAGLIGAS